MEAASDSFAHVLFFSSLAPSRTQFNLLEAWLSGVEPEGQSQRRCGSKDARNSKFKFAVALLITLKSVKLKGS